MPRISYNYGTNTRIYSKGNFLYFHSRLKYRATALFQIITTLSKQLRATPNLYQLILCSKVNSQQCKMFFLSLNAFWPFLTIFRCDDHFDSNGDYLASQSLPLGPKPGISAGGCWLLAASPPACTYLLLLPACSYLHHLTCCSSPLWYFPYLPHKVLLSLILCGNQ